MPVIYLVMISFIIWVAILFVYIRSVKRCSKPISTSNFLKDEIEMYYPLQRVVLRRSVILQDLEMLNSINPERYIDSMIQQGKMDMLDAVSNYFIIKENDVYDTDINNRKQMEIEFEFYVKSN